MKYADGPSTHCEIHIDAAPARIWPLVTDIELPARLSPELQRVEWLGSMKTPALGASFIGHNHREVLGEWRTLSTVIGLEPERTFAWAVVDPDGRFGGGEPDIEKPMAVWRFDLHPDHAGTRLRQAVRIGPARSGLTLAIARTPDKEERIVAHRLAELRKGMEETLRGIKTLAEDLG